MDGDDAATVAEVHLLRLEVVVSEAAGLGRQPQRPVILFTGPTSAASSVARRVIVRIPLAPDAAARMSQGSGAVAELEERLLLGTCRPGAWMERVGCLR